jgi:hypothetical protein
MTDSPFVLDLRSRSGRRTAQLPDDGGFALHEWTTWLRIRSDITGFVPPTYDGDADELTGFVPPVFERDGLALLTTVRNNADLVGSSIGLFHARLHEDELEQLRATVEAIPWAQLPRPSGGHVNAPQLELAYARDALLIHRSFNANSGNFLEAIAPLWRTLDGYLTRARKGPASTLELELEAKPVEAGSRAHELSVNLRVRGIGHVVLTDPRVSDGEPRLRVRVGVLESDNQPVEREASPHAGRSPSTGGFHGREDNPHARARHWVELPIPQLPADAESTLLLRPRARVALTLPWLAPGPGRYSIEARWRDYAGPLAPARGQTDFMPLPRLGPSGLGSGPYPIRGALFAQQELVVG